MACGAATPVGSVVGRGIAPVTQWRASPTDPDISADPRASWTAGPGTLDRRSGPRRARKYLDDLVSSGELAEALTSVGAASQLPAVVSVIGVATVGDDAEVASEAVEVPGVAVAADADDAACVAAELAVRDAADRPVAVVDAVEIGVVVVAFGVAAVVATAADEASAAVWPAENNAGSPRPAADAPAGAEGAEGAGFPLRAEGCGAEGCGTEGCGTEGCGAMDGGAMGGAAVGSTGDWTVEGAGGAVLGREVTCPDEGVAGMDPAVVARCTVVGTPAVVPVGRPAAGVRVGARPAAGLSLRTRPDTEAGCGRPPGGTARAAMGSPALAARRRTWCTAIGPPSFVAEPAGSVRLSIAIGSRAIAPGRGRPLVAHPGGAAMISGAESAAMVPFSSVGSGAS
jgi:hypothetical protein